MHGASSGSSREWMSFVSDASHQSAATHTHTPAMNGRETTDVSGPSGDGQTDIEANDRLPTERRVAHTTITLR